ncbi:MAG: U32 family peptidase [Desulfovibrionaceae bacterium]|nr:U32 family peptidase [Desulfovibrionaceae bacterium]
MDTIEHKPEILSPAGEMESALAAIHAGANAIFLGLKHFSARMKAENFTIPDVAKLTELAHKHDAKIYIALNTLVKPDDVSSLSNLIARLVHDVQPDAFIIQDVGIISIARQAHFKGEIHLSTLANITSLDAMYTAKALGADRVVLPREIHLDELQSLNASCPEGLALELFIHGALCYMVSGRCYWSSYLGGKSGLRGRCVQPCRRVYTQGGKQGRFFSSLDLSLENLIYDILPLHRISSWKIEGRKKGPHYVYHATKAYRLLRDYPNEPDVIKEAHTLLQYAISRETTSSIITSSKKNTPVELSKHTNTGIAIGNVIKKGDGFVLQVEKPLYREDAIRIGYEDEAWYTTIHIKENTSLGAEIPISFGTKKTPKKSVTAFLIDRKATLPKKELRALRKELESIAHTVSKQPSFRPQFARSVQTAFTGIQNLQSAIPKGKENKQQGLSLWLSPRTVREVSRTITPRITWWLPPVVWHEDESSFRSLIRHVCRNGAKRFVCNEFMQYSLLPESAIKMLGPFCNISNVATLHLAKECGYTKAIASMELSKEDLHSLARQSPLPLGLVTKGYFPIGITRFSPQGISLDSSFRSALKEDFWVRKYGSSYWFYPAWELDLSSFENELIGMGYSFFVHITEHAPKGVAIVRKQSTFNWNLSLL